MTTNDKNTNSKVLVSNSNINNKIQPKFEEMIFKNERQKRYKQNQTWHHHPELVDPTKKYYNDQDLKLIKELLYNTMPEDYRPTFWLIASGAKIEMDNHPNYYQNLVRFAKMAQDFPHLKSIELDLHRTFPSLPFFKEEKNIEKLNNILLAFAFRNSVSIGYCQGLNFIAGQLLLVINDEEKTFWVFTQLLEDYIPLDFYLKFTGVRIDMEIVKRMLIKKLPFIGENECLTICINNLISRCFISLYSETIQSKVVRVIWDALFVYGDFILFRTFTFIIYMFCDKNIEKLPLDKIHETFLKNLENISTTDLLNYFLLLDHTINASFVRESRKKKQKGVYEQNVNFKESIKGDGTNTCDKNNPYCIYNDDIANVEKYNTFKIFRAKNKKKYYENYFFGKCFENKEKEKNEECSKEINLDDLIVERHEHVCK